MTGRSRFKYRHSIATSPTLLLPLPAFFTNQVYHTNPDLARIPRSQRAKVTCPPLLDKQVRQKCGLRIIGHHATNYKRYQRSVFSTPLFNSFSLQQHNSSTMAYKCIVLAAVLAVANAGYLGGPAISYGAPALSYAAPALSYAAPVAVHAPSVGSSHESTVRSLDGNSAVTHYSKAVDSAFSSVRKVDTRVSNDAQALAYAPVATAYHGVAAPAIASYAAPTYAAAYQGLTSYSAPAYSTAYHGLAAPAVASYAAPAYATAYHGLAAPAYATAYHGVSTPMIAKSAVVRSLGSRLLRRSRCLPPVFRRVWRSLRLLSN
uniref:Uncharacterized protein n=1 Tax=Timema genevievae TaxID=629358 RepID=A0A7R9K2N3_TIMGE|nr:unnamed protein product [Timema genevievae]